MKIIVFLPILTLLILFLLLGDIDLTITHNNIQRNFKFNGIVWVALDRYSINKYHSKDIPKKFYTYTKTNK